MSYQFLRLSNFYIVHLCNSGQQPAVLFVSESFRTTISRSSRAKPRCMVIAHSVWVTIPPIMVNFALQEKHPFPNGKRVNRLSMLMPETSRLLRQPADVLVR